MSNLYDVVVSAVACKCLNDINNFVFVFSLLELFSILCVKAKNNFCNVLCCYIEKFVC